MYVTERGIYGEDGDGAVAWMEGASTAGRPRVSGEAAGAWEALGISEDERSAGAGAAVVAVIPAHNEERFIGSVVLTTRRYAATVIVVDDGSTDRTARLAEDAGAVVVRQEPQGGKARALTVGFQEARRRAAEVVVMLDADAQHDPSDIPRLAAPIVAGEADVVIGSRFLDRESEAPGWRRAGQRALTVATNVASGLAVTDSQSGFRALSGGVAASMLLTSRGLGAESEMQWWLSHSGSPWRVAEVPITAQYRDPMKRNPVRHGLLVVDTLARLVERRHPLLLLTLPGVLAGFAGTWIGVSLLRGALVGQDVPPLYGAVAFLLFISGLLVAVTGALMHRLEEFQTVVRELITQGTEAGPRGTP